MLFQLFQDKQFFRSMLTLATPIIIQNLITFSLGAVDMVMIGQLGEQAVAAVGLADQVFFLLILMLFGIASGAAIFTAQYWGKRDLHRIHKVLGLSLMLGLLGSLAFAGGALFWPNQVLSIYSTDPVVIALGSDYLSIVGWSYVASAVAVNYTFIMRSTEQVKLPLLVGAVALVLNTVMNYVLIFGHFGFPALGVAGAAMATAGARTLEAIILVSVIYAYKLPLAAPLRDLLKIDLSFVPKFLQTATPVVLTEVAWSLGITTYSIIYARIGTEAIAAINIVVTMERLAFVIFLGMSNACAIMIGNRIGSGEVGQAYGYAKRYLVLGVLGGVPVGVMVILGADSVLALYKVAPIVITYAKHTLFITGVMLPIRITALMLFIGVLRSGGDTRFSFFIDAGSIWLIGVPLALFGAFVLGLPVYTVYLLVSIEEVIKVIIALRRFFWGPWIHNLAEPETQALAVS